MYVSDKNILSGTGNFKFDMKPDYYTRKFNVKYCVIGYVQKIMTPCTLDYYYPVLNWTIVRSIFILH